MMALKRVVFFGVLFQVQMVMAADWDRADKRDWELSYIKGTNIAPLRALYGGAVDPVNDHLEYHPVPQARRELPDQVLEFIPYRVPDFSIRINDSAQAFVRIDGEIKKVVLEDGRYAYKPTQLTAAEFKKLPSLDKQSIVQQRSALNAFLQSLVTSYTQQQLLTLPKDKLKWKEKSFKTCGKIIFSTIFDGNTNTLHQIELPDSSILRIPTYQIQSMRCTAQGRMTVLLAYVGFGRPAPVRQSLLMLDTGIDFAAHEKASQTK
jgi:hypothetical protein